MSYAETLRVAVEEMPFLLKDRKVTISLGVSEQKQQEYMLSQQFYRVDMALYQAKQVR